MQARAVYLGTCARNKLRTRAASSWDASCSAISSPAVRCASTASRRATCAHEAWGLMVTVRLSNAAMSHKDWGPVGWN